ncbi:MAG: SDR family oxidoreductase [Novosphingobium sp.]|nr:SDR family oxidoreductase [Novosphingobium sp.]
MDFTGRHVVITGASSGIGRATAAKIAGLGGTVTLIARRSEMLEEVQRELGERTAWAAADVGDEGQLIAALDAAVERNGPIDALFLNAGAEGMYGQTPDYTDEALEEVLRVNAVSPFWAIRHVLPAMLERGRGSILITGSLAAETGMVGNIGYLMSKHAALGLARGIAMEAAAAGVRCNVLNPGFIATPMLGASPEDFKAKMAGRVPQQRLGTPEEAANVAAFLLSDDASHVTAQSWAVDGGLLGTLMI